MQKNIGYAAVLAGLGLMLYAVYTAIAVFTGAEQPAALIVIDKISAVMPLGNIEIPAPAYAAKMANLGTHLMLCFFLIFAGGKIASVGGSLLGKVPQNKENRPAAPPPPPPPPPGN